MTWAATGAVKKTNRIPKISRMLKYPSEMTKYNNVPIRINNTPTVELFDAAWERVYTSGKRTNPMALIKQINVPKKIKTPAMTSALPLNDDTPFNKSGKGYGPNKGQDTD